LRFSKCGSERSAGSSAAWGTNSKTIFAKAEFAAQLNPISAGAAAKRCDACSQQHDRGRLRRGGGRAGGRGADVARLAVIVLLVVGAAEGALPLRRQHVVSAWDEIQILQEEIILSHPVEIFGDDFDDGIGVAAGGVTLNVPIGDGSVGVGAVVDCTGILNRARRRELDVRARGAATRERWMERSASRCGAAIAEDQAASKIVIGVACAASMLKPARLMTAMAMRVRKCSLNLLLPKNGQTNSSPCKFMIIPYFIEISH
jgi:hypothetical protein